MSLSTPESVLNNRSDAPGQSQLHLVWTRFRQNRYALMAGCLILILFLIAIYAPLLAQNKPLVFDQNGAIGSPLLREIFAPSDSPERILEQFFNFVMVLTTASTVILLPLWAMARTHSRNVARHVIRTGLVILAVATLVPFTVVRPRLDKTNYRQLASAPTPGTRIALMPPVPFGPFEQPAMAFGPPSHKHLLGTDKIGRDVLARLIHGTRVSLSVGFVAVAIYLIIGIMIGSLAAYLGGWTDLIVQRCIEVVICFPTFLLILTLMAFVDHRSIFNVVLVIGLTGWTQVARLVRGEVLKQKQLDYVAAARALGLGRVRIIFRHILPNAMAPVLVAATFGVAGAILTETSLSFLGFGVRQPTASWGELLNQAQAWPTGYWWLMAWPGVMIFTTVTVFNLVGEGLRDALDPR